MAILYRIGVSHTKLLEEERKLMFNRTLLKCHTAMLQMKKYNITWSKNSISLYSVRVKTTAYLQLCPRAVWPHNLQL